MSLPSWERGLKFMKLALFDYRFWVAPLVGAWIEINTDGKHAYRVQSLPSWERGLKFVERKYCRICRAVAPLVGAWIEISSCACFFR